MFATNVSLSTGHVVTSILYVLHCSTNILIIPISLFHCISSLSEIVLIYLNISMSFNLINFTVISETILNVYHMKGKIITWQFYSHYTICNSATFLRRLISKDVLQFFGIAESIGHRLFILR